MSDPKFGYRGHSGLLSKILNLIRQFCRFREQCQNAPLELVWLLRLNSNLSHQQGRLWKFWVFYPEVWFFHLQCECRQLHSAGKKAIKRLHLRHHWAISVPTIYSCSGLTFWMQGISMYGKNFNISDLEINKTVKKKFLTFTLSSDHQLELVEFQS